MRVFRAVLIGVTTFCVVYLAAWTNARQSLDRWHTEDWKSKVLLLRERLSRYRFDRGQYPASLGHLFLRDDQALARAISVDSWGRPIQYESAGDSYRLRTLGRDGSPGGFGLDADLVADNEGRIPLVVPTFGQMIYGSMCSENVLRIAMSTAIISTMIFLRASSPIGDGGVLRARPFVQFLVVLAIASAIAAVLGSVVVADLR